MKKRIALLLGMIMIASSLAGCGGGKVASVEETPAATEEADGESEATAEGALKTGLAITADVSGSKDAAEEDGTAQTDVTMAAVTVDAEGKIVACTIDSLQVKIGFDTEGKITTDMAAQFQSKQELGENYGMKAASSIGKEWNEQADGFAAYCVGKTVDEINGIAVAEDGKAEDAELAASCTVYFGGFQAIVTKAVENAVESYAQVGDKLGLAAVTSIAKSKDAAEEDGTAQAYVTVNAVTVDAEGKITSAIIDAVQANVKFDATGKITSDLTAEVLTKNELGDDYGMKAASTIGKEWNEQAAAYAAYTIGKTVDEVNGTAVNEGVPADADLASSVTVHITDFNSVITKAVSNAK